jgi:hypothetical protein
MSAPPGSLTLPLRVAVVVANWALVLGGTPANSANTTAMMLHKGSPLRFKTSLQKKLQFEKSRNALTAALIAVRILPA